jgi:hypothetical protein
MRRPQTFLLMALGLWSGLVLAAQLSLAPGTASSTNGVTTGNKQYSECGGFFVWVPSKVVDSSCNGTTNCGDASTYFNLPFNWMPFTKDQPSATTQPTSSQYASTVTQKQLCNGGTYTVSMTWNLVNEWSGRWLTISAKHNIVSGTPVLGNGSTVGTVEMNTTTDNAYESSTGMLTTTTTIPATGTYNLNFQSYNNDCHDNDCHYWMSGIGYVFYDGKGTPY